MYRPTAIDSAVVAFAVEHVPPPIVFRFGQPGGGYSGIGRDETKIEELPNFADQRGPFGSTTRIVSLAASLLGAMGRTLHRAVGLLERYVAASDTEVGVVE